MCYCGVELQRPEPIKNKNIAIIIHYHASERGIYIVAGTGINKPCQGYLGYWLSGYHICNAALSFHGYIAHGTS